MPWMPTANPPIQSPVVIDEVGEAHVRPALALGDLLAQQRQRDMLLVLRHGR